MTLPLLARKGGAQGLILQKSSAYNGRRSGLRRFWVKTRFFCWLKVGKRGFGWHFFAGWRSGSIRLTEFIGQAAMVLVRLCSVLIGEWINEMRYRPMRNEFGWARLCGGWRSLVDLTENPVETVWRRGGGMQSKSGTWVCSSGKNELWIGLWSGCSDALHRCDSRFDYWFIRLSISHRPCFANSLFGSWRVVKLTKVGSHFSAHLLRPPGLCSFGASFRAIVLCKRS